MKNSLNRYQLSYRDQVKKQYLEMGILWLVMGAFQILFSLAVQGDDVYSNWFRFVEIACIFVLLVVLYLTFTVMKKTKEAADEMAIANIRAAKEAALDIGLVILMTVSIFLPSAKEMLGADLNLALFIKPFIFIFIGVDNLIVAYKFKTLEDE